MPTLKDLDCEFARRWPLPTDGHEIESASWKQYVWTPDSDLASDPEPEGDDVLADRQELEQASPEDGQAGNTSTFGLHRGDSVGAQWTAATASPVDWTGRQQFRGVSP